MIDTSTWKKYILGDLFDMHRGTGYGLKGLIEGDTPLISATTKNNSIVAYASVTPKFDAETITITTDGAGMGYATVQMKPFDIASNAVAVLPYDNNVGLYAKFFVCAVIKQYANRFSYKDKMNRDQLLQLEVYLPATSDGQPDWDYMESYMKAVMEESEKSLESLKKADDTKHLIDVSGWGEFSCKELFECKNTGNILARDVIDGSGDTPYVTASGYNNGVVAHIDASNYEIIKGHCILVGGKTFTITYQKDDFVSNDSHNFIIRVKDYDISDLDYLYLTSMIYAYFGQKYSWNDAVTKDKLLDESIPLPITSTGEPGWQYMEDYMKNIMNKQEMAADNLSKIV